ncbi:hypothetical protein BUALT_Bualt03G0061400 [Buddleja alternifolia]|uniref:Dof zinc finger protein n=1 Tax=Buddleja alternifolia TaxID=168488 RepID=A0AAV6XYV9_9LAMI|nr:hypothetical protein BUALT_Bualt03G0061400 [Buddleja alternifolia]
MGLSTKQVSGDQGLDWGQTLSGAAEMSKPPPARRQQLPQRQSEPLKCPRCASTNTKFCYYNNYNKSQPRHFCKSCKRHWTKGGTLRNVPVGGGRKNKRPKIPSAAVTDAPPQQDSPNILYEALIRSSSPLLHETKPFSNGAAAATGLMNMSAPQNANTEFQFTSLSTFEESCSWINPTCYQSLNVYDEHYTGNLDSINESGINSVSIPSTSSVPWPGPNSSLELPNYWNWNEINVSGDLNIAWDDDHHDDDDNASIKP